MGLLSGRPYATERGRISTPHYTEAVHHEEETQYPAKTPEGKTIVYYSPDAPSRNPGGVVFVDPNTGQITESVDGSRWRHLQDPRSNEYRQEGADNIEYRQVPAPTQEIAESIYKKNEARYERE